MIDSEPKFIQGVFGFTGAGYDNPVPLPGGTYTVAPGLNLYLEYLYGQVKQPGYNLLLGTANAITSPTIGQRVQTQYMGIGTALTW